MPAAFWEVLSQVQDDIPLPIMDQEMLAVVCISEATFTARKSPYTPTTQRLMLCFRSQTPRKVVDESPWGRCEES